MNVKGIICEHYVEEGVISEVIRGESAEDIANAVIKRGLLSRLDHAAYLGRELCYVFYYFSSPMGSYTILWVTSIPNTILHKDINLIPLRCIKRLFSFIIPIER